jgi:hypothetical protein
MNERDLAERFNQDVDRLLNGPGGARRTLAEYRQAPTWRAAPFNRLPSESCSRLALRRRLLSDGRAREFEKGETDENVSATQVATPVVLGD